MNVIVLGTRGFPNIQGGLEKHSEKLYPLLAAMGVNITVICRKNYFKKADRLKQWHGIRFIYLWSPKQQSLETVVHTFLACLIAIWKRPDIAHFHNMGPALFLPLMKIFGIKTVFTYHSINYLHNKWSLSAKIALRAGEYLGIRYANKVIIVSNATRQYLLDKKIRKDLIYIPNGKEIPKAVKDTGLLNKFNLKKRKYVFTATRFSAEKGVLDLIDAYNMLDNPKFKLVIAGQADFTTNYSRKVIKIASGNPNIVLTGFRTGDELGQLYSNAGLFVLPSYSEGMSISMLEAISYSLPICASNIPQNREFMLPDYRYFPPGSIPVLSEKLSELFKKGIGWKEKKAMHRMLEENYNWENIAKTTYDIYNDLHDHSSTKKQISGFRK